MRTALPDAAYLEAIGRHAYLVSSLEWSVLGDLPHLPGLPAGLTVEALAGETTGRIAKALRTAAPLVRDKRTRRWLEAGAEALEDASEQRNHLLHARPATDSEGRQRLYRWRRRTTKGGTVTDAFFITDEWLVEQEHRLDAAGVRLGALRVLEP